MVNGMRKMRDGVAFFGKQLKNVNFFSQNKFNFFQGEHVVVDFELNIDYPGTALYTFIMYYKKGY